MALISSAQIVKGTSQAFAGRRVSAADHLLFVERMRPVAIALVDRYAAAAPVESPLRIDTPPNRRAVRKRVRLKIRWRRQTRQSRFDVSGRVVLRDSYSPGIQNERGRSNGVAQERLRQTGNQVQLHRSPHSIRLAECRGRRVCR